MAGNPRIDELRKKLDKEPGSRLFAQLAEELRKDGDLEDAIQVAREGLQKHSNYPSARMTLGRALFDTGDWAAARAEFELVLKGAPDNILASRLLAESLEGLGDVAAAVARYKKTLILAPGDKQVLERLEALEGGGAVASGTSARAATPDVAPAASPAPIRVVEVDTPMELEQTHERATAFSAGPPAPAAPAPVVAGPPSPSPTESSPAPIPVSSAEEDFELERPYEPPRPVATSVPAAPPEPRGAEAVAPPRPAAESMMEFEFEPGPTGSTIPFAPAPAPAPLSTESAPNIPAPTDAPPPPPSPPVAAAPPPAPPPPATPPPPPAVFAPEPVREPAPEPPAAAAARTVEVPWSAPPPPRMAPPPPRMAPPPPPPAPVPEPVRAEESASGELTSPTLAELYFKQGFPDKAVEVYRQLVDREPDNDRLRRRLAELQEDRSAAASAVADALPAPAAGATPAARASDGPDRASRRVALERTIARLEGLLAAIKKG